MGLIFVAFYTATLTANMTVAKFAAQINSPADLLGKRVCTVANTAPAEYLNSIGVEAQGVAAIDDCYATLKKGDLDAVVFDSQSCGSTLPTRVPASPRSSGRSSKRRTMGSPSQREARRRRFDEGCCPSGRTVHTTWIKQKWFGFENAGSADQSGS